MNTFQQERTDTVLYAADANVTMHHTMDEDGTHNPVAVNEFSSALYRLHGFRVLDAQGKFAGTVDWIWADAATNRGEFLGVRLHWIRGSARAIPAVNALVDVRTRTIRVPHTARQIRRADRLKIDRALTAREKRRVCFQYHVEPRVMPGRREHASLAPAA